MSEPELVGPTTLVSTSKRASAASTVSVYAAFAAAAEVVSPAMAIVAEIDGLIVSAAVAEPDTLYTTPTVVLPPDAAMPPTLSSPAPFNVAKLHGTAIEQVPLARPASTYPTNVEAGAVPVKLAPEVTWKVPVPDAVVFVSVNVSVTIDDGVTL
jgi:hypothetical protein